MNDKCKMQNYGCRIVGLGARATRCIYNLVGTGVLDSQTNCRDRRPRLSVNKSKTRIVYILRNKVARNTLLFLLLPFWTVEDACPYKIQRRSPEELLLEDYLVRRHVIIVNCGFC